MVFRRHVIASAETLDDSETYPVKLDGLGALSALEIEVTATNGSSYNKNNHIHDLVTKIEIVDGSEQYFSLSGIQTQILDWATMRRIPLLWMDESPNVTQIGNFIVPLGQKPGDPFWWLDVDKMKNPRANITFNIGQVATASATTAFVSGSGKITVKAIIDQEKTGLSQKGYFRTLEKEKFTTAASGDHTLELPIDFPYRMLMVRAYKQNSDPLGAFNNIKLEFDSPKYKYLDEGTSSYMRAVHNALGLPGWVTKWCRMKNGDIPEWPCMRNQQLVFVSDGNLERFISPSNFWKGYVPIALTDRSGAGIATEETHEGSLYTWMFQNGLIIPFGQPLLEDNFFPANTYKKSVLTLSQGSVSHAASVCLQEVATQ